MRHTLLLAASTAALMAIPALAQEQQPATPATEQPAATATATTGGSALQVLALAAEQVQTVADQIQGNAGVVGSTDALAGGAANTLDSAAATTDGTAIGSTTGSTTGIGTTTGGAMAGMTGMDMQQMQQQATQALDQFDQAVQQVGGSPEGQAAEAQVTLLQQQSEQVRQQLAQDPQLAANGMRELARAAMQVQTAQIPADARSIVGKPLVSSDGQEVGQVSNVLITPDGQVNALVIERGGALGLGGRQVAVQWAQVQVQGDQLAVGMSSGQIDQMPEYQVD